MYPRKILDFARERALVQPLRIALDARLERRVDEYFKKIAGREKPPHRKSFGAERRDRARR